MYWWYPSIIDNTITGNTFENAKKYAGVEIRTDTGIVRNAVFENNTIIQTNGLPPILNYTTIDTSNNTIITDVLTQTPTFTVIPPTVTMSATSTPTLTPTSTSVPTYTPTITPTVTPKPDLCVRVVWDKGLNLRPGATMYNIAQGYMSQGMEFEPLSTVENSEGSFAEFGRGWFVAMNLNSNPDNIYAEACK